MAIAKTKLEYISLSTGNWVQAVNTNGQDAVVMLNIEQSINASAKADIILSNRSIDPTSDGSPAKGPLTDVFAEFQRIRLVHQEIGIPIFSGRIYRVRDVYDAQYGQTIRVVAFDSLKEFREYPIEDAADSLESVDTTDADEGGYDLRKRSQVIKYMLDELNLKDTNLLTTDTNHFEDSWSTASLGDKKLNLTKLDRNVAGVINDLAIGDPVKDSNATAIGESGYDYRVEPRFLSSAANHKPIDSLHYFMRGTRPGKGGAYGASAAPIITTTSTDSLTIEYTNSTSPADSGLKQTMMPTYEFDKPKAELLTSVICHYTDEGKEDESSNDESGGKTEGVVTFELFKGSALSGTFTWAGKALDVNKPGVVNVPELLNISGGLSSACRVQWQNTDSNYLLVSHISPNFPTADSDITLTGATSGATFVMNPATARMSVKYGVQRPFRIQRPLSSDLGIIRDEIVSRLVGRTDLVITRGKFQTVKYPIVYHELVNTATPPASTASRSSNTITWTGAIAAKVKGVRLGHIIAEMDSAGGYTRYAYISAVTNERSINYGASATDTSDGTALDASKVLRVIIPLRPGDVIRVKNAQSGVNTDQVILSLGYDESPGMFSARYETVGSNNKFNNIYEEGEELRAAVAALTPKKFPDPKSLGETSFFFNGFINRGVNPSGANDYRQIHWTNAAADVSGTSGTLTFGDGTKYTIACANSAILTTAEHTIFFRPAKARATANTSDTTFQVVLTTSYNKDPDDILVGWCFASDNKAGAKAVLVLAPQFSSKDLFASGQNGTLTEALFSKSAQEYSSGLEIVPVTSGSDRHRQVTWAACTATSGSDESPDDRLTFGDGDVWSIAAKSGNNYSVTTNGSTYANITALALSSTYYVFIDTADTASGGTLTLRFTTSYSHISTASDGTFFSSKVIMGQIAVPANGDNGAAPRIFPFNNRSLTVNAASIAADAITATHITASTVTTIQQGTTKSDVGLGNVDNNSTNTIRDGVTVTHVTDTMTGVTMTQSGNIFSGSKTTYQSDTSGWFIGFDQEQGTPADHPRINIGSGSNRIRWTGSSLEIIGSIKITASSDTLTEQNTFNTNTVGSDLGTGYGDSTIGGWTLAADALFVTNKQTSDGFQTNGFTLAANGSIHATNFFVNDDGAAGFKGDISGASGTFTGGISVDSGNVTINNNGIQIVNGSSVGSSSFIDFTGIGNAYFIGRYTSGGTDELRIGRDDSAKIAIVGNLIPGTGEGASDLGVDEDDGGWGKIMLARPNRDVTILTTNDSGELLVEGTGIGGVTIASGSGMASSTSGSSGTVTITMGAGGTVGINSNDDVGTSTHNHPFSTSGFDFGALIDVSDLADTSATGAELDTLTNGSSSNADSLHSHAGGTINSGAANRGAYYASAGTTLSGTSYQVTSTTIGSSSNPLTNLHSTGGEITNLDVTGLGGLKCTNLGNMTGQNSVVVDSNGILGQESSSRRYKDNIRALEIDSSQIYSLEPKTFEAKPREDGTLQPGTFFGLIAEEVYEVIPELVGIRNDVPDNVRYHTISVLLLAEMKKLKARIEVLEGN